MCTLKVYSIHYTLRSNTNVKKISKINGTKIALFFLSRAPTHHSFTFSLGLLYEMKHKVRFSKTISRIFHFRFCFVFITHGLFDLKTSNSFENQNNRKATHSFALRPLILKLQQEVLKFNDI